MENKKEYRSNIAEGEIIIYQAEDGHTKIDVKFVDEISLAYADSIM